MSATQHPVSSQSLRDYLQVLRRKRLLIIVVAVLTSILGALPTLLSDPEYASTAQVQAKVLNREGVFDVEGEGAPSSTQDLRELLTEIETMSSGMMRAKVIAQFEDPPEFDGPEAALVGYSEVVSIRVKANDPATAADVANAYADIFVAERQEDSGADLIAKADELRAQSAAARGQYDTLGNQLLSGELSPTQFSAVQLQQTTLASQFIEYERRADELTVEASLRGRGTKVVAPAELELDPVSPPATQGAGIGLALGLLLGLGLAIVVDMLQDRVGTRDDLAAVDPQIPVLAAVPHADFDSPAGRSSFSVQEAYRYLRTGIRLLRMNDGVRSILVTSAVGAEGKTTTATNMAQAMAETGDRVVLIDCDLRRPALHTRFGLTNEIGLTSLVLGEAELADVTHFVKDNLAVITAGPSVMNPTEVLESAQFASIIRALSEQTACIIVDSPPVLPVADAVIASRVVDGVLVVSRIGEVRRRSLKEALGRLKDANLPVIGFVANDTSEEAPYGYYYTPEEQKEQKTRKVSETVG